MNGHALDAESIDADVMIVGAGPAGCAVAVDLVATGARVLLLDRAPFPRRKPCAGGLTIKAVRALRYSITAVTERTVNGLAVSHRLHRRRALTASSPICHLVERTAFDRFCLQKAIDSGARFEVIGRIEALTETNRHVSLVSGRRVLRAPYLIGADGAHSRVRVLSGRFPGFTPAFAVEGIVANRSADHCAMGFDFDCCTGGYGWVFPKAGHLNVGLYNGFSRAGVSRRDLMAYTARRLKGAVPTRLVGYPLGLGGWRYDPGRGRVLLTGDAAGLVDPLLGEGIYHAIASGQHAAAAVAGALAGGVDACQAYARRLAPIRRDLIFSRIVAAIFYRLPSAGFQLLTASIAAGPLMKGFARGLTLSAIFRWGFHFWFNLPLPPARPSIPAPWGNATGRPPRNHFDRRMQGR